MFYITACNYKLLIFFRLTKNTIHALIKQLIPFMPEVLQKTAIFHELQVQYT